MLFRSAWIRRALAGDTPVPLPIVNQLATCLFAAGYTGDMNQAKAIVAVETGSRESVGALRGLATNTMVDATVRARAERGLQQLGAQL